MSSETKRYYVERCDMVWSRCVVEAPPRPTRDMYPTEVEWQCAHDEWTDNLYDSTDEGDWKELDSDLIDWGEIEEVDGDK